MMDFYTIRTEVDLCDESTLARVIVTIGFFSQPLIMGEAIKEGSESIFRFAVRHETIRAFEDNVIEHLAALDLGFTKGNTTLVRADRI